MKKEISVQYSKALELHNKILVSAQLAQTNLWEMCSGLKEMRDGKLYRELGYQNFEEYCQTEFNMNRSNAHKYISIIENINPENVSTSKHFGVTKLYLLSTLSEAEQAEMTEKNDVESMTVKELEAEIKTLKRSNEEKKSQLQSLNNRLENANDSLANYRYTVSRLNTQNDKLQEQIKELESRPVEVAVAEPSEDVRQLKLTIKNLEQSTEQQLEDLQNQQIRDVRELHRKHDEELKTALAEQKSSYERKLNELKSRLSDADTEENTLALLEVYISTARNALVNLMAFASRSMDRSSCFSQIKSLLVEFEKANDELIYGR